MAAVLAVLLLVGTGFQLPPAACGMAPVNLSKEGKTMSEIQAVAKVNTDLTCWSCGEESLKEVFEAVDPNAFRPAGAIETAIMQSKCTKCGAQSINAAQARINKVNARKSRKLLIKEANRNSA